VVADRLFTEGGGMVTTARHITTLLADVRALVTELAQAGHGDEDAAVRDRLERSVLRPLEQESALPPGAPAAAGPAEGVGVEPRDVPLNARLMELAERATRMRLLPDAGPTLLEATAALQDLVADDREALSGLARLQADVPASITVATNGPYLVTNVPELVDWLGVPLPVRPQLALCRCGRSERKPLCDGSHRAVGFTDAKDPHRIPDRRDSYPGLGVTVLDNRGVCAHSGFCTDRLPTVFHAGSEPFVTPSGGRMDEIVRAVRSCPSGALSFATDDREAREQVDQPRPPAIEVSRDGPYRVTGGLPLLGSQGEPVERNAGASLEHYSLCRCGQSQNKPFCSGMHWYVEFRDPPAVTDREPTLFEWAGGLPALTRMTRLFYEKHVPEDPLLAPLFATMRPDHPERVASWLGEVFGGPPRYTQRYGGYPRMIGQHLGRALSEEQRARWVQLICRSADDAKLPDDPEFRAAFVAYLEWGSRIAKENSTPGAKPPPDMPVPRWSWVCDAYPDTRVAALAPEDTAEEPAEEPPPVLPAPGETVSFTGHIRPLFRDRDRRSMRFAFDLWSSDDVRTHAQAILDQVEAGTMPCDGRWPDERVEALRRWVATGMAE